MKSHVDNIDRVVNDCPEKSLLVKCKFVGDEFVHWHYFCSEDEVHGYIIGVRDFADHLGFAIEYITVNGEFVDVPLHTG